MIFRGNLDRAETHKAERPTSVKGENIDAWNAVVKQLDSTMFALDDAYKVIDKLSARVNALEQNLKVCPRCELNTIAPGSYLCGECR